MATEKKCPQCGRNNNMNAKTCYSCEYDFETHTPSTTTHDVCPMCGTPRVAGADMCVVCHYDFRVQAREPKSSMGEEIVHQKSTLSTVFFVLAIVLFVAAGLSLFACITSALIGIISVISCLIYGILLLAISKILDSLDKIKSKLGID